MSAPEAPAEVFRFRCADCEALFDEPGEPLYECSRCNQQSTERRCDECHIFMARVEGPGSCPECESGEIEEGEFSPPPPPTAAEIAEQEAQSERTQKWMAEMSAENAARRWARQDRWRGPEGLATAFDGIADRDDRDLGTMLRGELFLSSEGGASLDDRAAVRIACRILDRPEPKWPERDLMAPGRDYDTYRAFLADLWQGPEGLQEAFRGLPSASESHWAEDGDLGSFVGHMFGVDGCSGLGFRLSELEAIAARILDR